MSFPPLMSPKVPRRYVELEVPVGEVGLDARLAEAGHPVNLPQQVERVSAGLKGAGGAFPGGPGFRSENKAKKSLTRAPTRGKLISR